MDKKIKINIFILTLFVSEQIDAQFVLPTFQAVHQKRLIDHPGFGVVGLTFDNHQKWGTGDDYISIPWSSTLKPYTADDSTSFTVTMRAQLPVGSHYYRRNDYYSSPSHTIRGAYYHDGGNRIFSSVTTSSGSVLSQLEKGTLTRSTSVANHTTSWSGKYSENVQSIHFDSNKWYWIGYNGTANPSTGVFSSDRSGPKLWMKTNSGQIYNPNKSMSDVLVESSASGSADYMIVSYSSLNDMVNGNSGSIGSSGLGATGVGGGSFNYVLDLDGSNDHIRLPNSINTGSSDFTIELWLKTDDVGSRQHVFQQSGTNDNRVIAINSGGALTSRIDASGSDLNSGSTLLINTWYHIALVHDDSENTLKWYVDAVAKNTNTSVSIPSNTGGYFRLGTNSSANDKFFDGQLDEIRIWSDIRTESEISDNKDSELAGNESGLVAYYKLSNGTGTDLSDNSLNANDGTLNNMVTSGESTDWLLSNAPTALSNDYPSIAPAGAYSVNSMHFYLNGVLAKAHGFTNTITGSTTGTGYLGRNVYDFGGGSKGPFTRLISVTEYAYLSYCDPSIVSSLHSAQGSNDLRIWAGTEGKSLGIYYSLSSAINDGDVVNDLSGNGRNGTAHGF